MAGAYINISVSYATCGGWNLGNSTRLCLWGSWAIALVTTWSLLTKLWSLTHHFFKNFHLFRHG